VWCGNIFRCGRDSISAQRPDETGDRLALNGPFSRAMPFAFAYERPLCANSCHSREVSFDHTRIWFLVHTASDMSNLDSI
jgi:hypothetical protein